MDELSVTPDTPRIHARTLPRQLHTLREVASILRKSPRWLQDFIRDHPYYRRAGRTPLFTDEDINRLIEALPCPGSSSPRVPARRRIGTSGARTATSNLTE